MSLIRFSAACLAALLVTHYAILPWLRRSVRLLSTPAALAQAAWIAVVRYARGIMLAAVVTSLAVAGLVEVLRARAQPLVRTANVRRALERERALKRGLDAAHPYWLGTAALLTTAALGYYTYRRRRIQCTTAFAAAQDAEIERLVRAMNDDPTWWDLPPSDDMRRVFGRMIEIRDQLPALPDHLKSGAEQAIEQLRGLLIQLDVLRRVRIELDPDAIEDPAPETWRDWAAGLVGGTRVVGATRGATRLLYRGNAVLLVAGLIGLQSAGVDRVVQDRLVGLNDLVVRLDNLDAVEGEVAQAEADAQAEPAAPEEPSRDTSSSPTRVPTSSSRLAAKLRDVKARAETLKASRPAYEAEDQALRQAKAQADELVARRQAFDELAVEARRAADAVDREAGAPADGTRDRLAKLRERLNKEPAGAAPDRFVKPKADALKERLAGMDPTAEVRALDGEAAALEREAVELKAAVGSRPRVLDAKLDAVGHLDGRDGEIAALRERVGRLRSDGGARYVRASGELKTVRAGLGAEQTRRIDALAPRRAEASAFASRAATIDRAEALLPARADEARTLLSAADAKADWIATRPGGGDGAPALAAGETEAAQVVARSYEEALGESAPIRAAVAEPDAAAAAKLRALATRDAILDRAARVAPTERIRPPSLADAPGLTPGQQEVARSAQSIFRNDAPRTFAGKAMRDEVLAEMRRSPRFRETVVAQAQAARARLAAGSGTGLRAPPGRRFWSELAQTAIEGAVERVAGPEAADAVGEISRATLSNYEKARRYEFIRDLARGDKGLESALDRVAAQGAKTLLPETGRDYLRRVHLKAAAGGDAARAIAPFEPAIEVPFERGVKLERAGSIVMEQTTRGKPLGALQRARVFSEPLENYGGTFPSQPGIERVTPRGQLLDAIARDEAALAKGVGKPRLNAIETAHLGEWSAGRKFSATASLVKEGRIAPPKVALPGNAANTAERARSFLRLHSSPRVGGVLIGRKPEAETPARPLRPTALRWEVDAGAGAVRLLLVDPDGTARRSRPFRRDLTELALAYAADGRPTAVTIVTAPPLYDRKVLLHPALVDTAAGRAIAATDMIIFELIQHESWYVEPYLAVLNQVELYRRAWALRQAVLGPLGVLNPEYVEEVERHLGRDAAAYRRADAGAGPARGELAHLTADTDKAGVVAALTETARDPDALRDPERSPIAAKPAYFDPELVADMVSAAGPGRSLDEFDGALRRAALNRLGDLADWLQTREVRERALIARADSFKARTANPITDEATYRALTSEQAQLNADVSAWEAQAKANGARLDPILRRWTAPVPKLAHVSGIRERAFARTEADCFVADGKDLPTVLDFLIQITYDTSPYFLKGAPPAAEEKAAWEELAAFADDAPWEFPKISARVREAVRKALADDPARAGDRDGVATLAEFTVLQRLFRLGLEGELGPDFPVEALAALHREVAPASPPPAVRTPRWDTRPGSLERSLKEYVDRALGSGDSGDVPAGLRAPLKALSAAVDEYAAKVSERDRAAAAAGESGAPSPSREAAWEAFQAWAEGWEDRLARGASDLDRAAQSGPTRAQARLSESFPIPGRLGGPAAANEKAEEIAGMVRWTVSAIELRRALNVGADDPLARADARWDGRIIPAP